MSDIPDDEAKRQEEIKEWVRTRCNPETAAATEKHIQEMLETAGMIGVGKYLDENEQFNPILLSKAIMKDHEFVYDETSRKLYVYSQDQKRFIDSADDLIRRQIALRLDESTRSRIFPDVQFYITATAKTRNLDEHPELIIVENGILDVLARTLKPFSSENFLTVKLHVKFDEKAECSKIQKFLSEILAENQISVLQEAVGYTLFRKMIHHKAFLFLGNGANGKSTLLELVHKFLGYENCSALTIQDINYNRFGPASLYTKLANICSDLPAIKLEQTGPWKRTTGGDVINARAFPISTCHVKIKNDGEIENSCTQGTQGTPTQEEKIVCGHCKKWHTGACVFSGDPNCVTPLNPFAKTCPGYDEGEALPHE